MAGETPELVGYEEEKLDRYFFRPLAHPVARAAAKLGLTPNAVSVIGMLLGAAGGYFFQFRDWRLVGWGVALVCLRNIFDYADGQLARMTGKGTRWGQYFDGLCDYGATVSVYVFGAIGIWPEYGFWAAVLAVAAGVSGSLQSNLLDFQKGQYRYWALGSDKDAFRTPEFIARERAQARGFDRFVLWTALGYARQQAALTSTRRALHDEWLPHRGDDGFRLRYSLLNRWPLKVWFLVGPNWHAYLFFAFGLLGRMDLFFVTQIVVLNAVTALVALCQAACDRRLARELAAGPTS